VVRQSVHYLNAEFCLLNTEDWHLNTKKDLKNGEVYGIIVIIEG
jgi:hypothetical protein